MALESEIDRELLRAQIDPSAADPALRQAVGRAIDAGAGVRIVTALVDADDPIQALNILAVDPTANVGATLASPDTSQPVFPVTPRDVENARTFSGLAEVEPGVFGFTAEAQLEAERLSGVTADTAAAAAGGGADDPGAALETALQQGGLAFRGFAADGTIIAADSNGRLFNVDVDENGALQFLGDADSVLRPGGTGRAPARPQFVGTDDRTGEALFFDPNTGSISRGEQIGFEGISPQEEAAESARRFDAQQALDEAGFIGDVLSSGRDFLTAAFTLRGQAPPRPTVTQADVINFGLTGDARPLTSAGAAAAGGGAAGGPAGATPSRAQINEGLAGQAGGGRFTFGPATATGGGRFGPGGSEAVGAAGAGGAGAGFGGPVSQQSLVQLGRQFSPPAVSDVFAGREVGTLGSPVPLPSPTSLGNLTPDEQGALDTRLRTEAQSTFGELQQASRQRFLPGRSRRGFLVN